MYKFSSGEKIYFTSDTHFCHKNIISYAGRPFSSTEKMDKALIDNWNSVVPEDGIVFHLGDFCFSGSTQWKTIRKKLNGEIYLILGNHDFKNYKPAWSDLFEIVTQQMHIYVEDQEIYINHNPFLVYGMPDVFGANAVNLSPRISSTEGTLTCGGIASHLTNGLSIDTVFTLQ